MGIYMLSSKETAEKVIETIEELEGSYTDKVLKNGLMLVLDWATKRKKYND